MEALPAYHTSAAHIGSVSHGTTKLEKVAFEWILRPQLF
jgi:hypothetical protein